MADFSLIAILLIIVLALFVAGLILLIRGWRGRARFSEPHCTRCDYDLRTLRFDEPATAHACPECGADLNAKGAVRYANFQRRRGMMVCGIVLILLPFLLMSLLLFVNVPSGRGGRIPTATTPTSAIIANLANSAEEPWDWQELERRYKTGTLSNADIAAAIDQVIVYLSAVRAEGQRVRPLPWFGPFMTSLMTNGDISAEQFGRLCQAFYSQTVPVHARKTIRPGWLAFEIERSNSIDLSGNVRCIKAVTQVLVDGKPVPIGALGSNPAETHPDQLSGEAAFAVCGQINVEEPGEHNVTFVVSRGIVPANSPFTGMDGHPGQPERWHNSSYTWVTKPSVKVRVVPPEIAMVELVDDPAFDPVAAGAVQVKQAFVRLSSHGRQLTVEWSRDVTPPVPICFRIIARIGKTEREVGYLSARTTGFASTGGSTGFGALDPSITQIDLRLEPHIPSAENYEDMDQIWGKTITLENVPLQRFDLEIAAPVEQETGGG